MKAKQQASFKEKAVALVKTKNFRIAAIAGLAAILVLCLILGLALGLKGCTGMKGILKRDTVTVNSYSQTTKVGYSYKTLGTVKRNKPVDGVHDERDAFPLGITVADDARYPKYGYTMSTVIGTDADKVNARNQLIAESSYLCAFGTSGANSGGTATPDKYTWMDKDGWLYQGTRAEPVKSLVKTATGYGTQQRQLYKHTASVGLYLGDVADSEPGIIKQVTLRPRGYGSYSVTGVYAPAGEVIKIQLSGADMDATGGIIIHIGQALYNGQANNIWTGKNQMQRMAHIVTTLVINKNTAEYDEKTDTWTGYIGSFLGGPVYIRNTTVNVTATISGGVAYRHFVLGYTTPEEYEQLCKSTAPYFDLEVWEYGVLHSGPVNYASSFSYDDLYKAAVLWEKVSTVTTTNGTKQGIVFLYDPFVAAGGAVAFPGRSSVNCPMGWMASSLNYDSIVTSGSWGNFHEYHHNFQNYGVTGSNGEVTNNGLNLVSYSLFTNISSARQISGYGGAGLSGWNQYTSATWTLNRVNNGTITGTNGLAIYATLLHNLGQDAYIYARGTTGTNTYLDKWATITHQDFTYFASRITAYGTGNYSPSDAVKQANYPLFVPVSSVYQTGRTYNYDGQKREINTMQPYVIPYGVPFTVDLNEYTVNAAEQYEYGSVVIGSGFKFSIKSVNAEGINGTFVKSGDNIYTFTPNTEMRSGKIYVTLEITTTDGAHEWNGHKLEDVDLVLEFQQSHEWNKNVLERTTYYYTADTVYTDAREAYENGYAGYESRLDRDHSNPTQNANTDIWYCTDNTISRFPNANPELDIVKENSIDELRGKLYIVEDGKYRIYLRGRRNCALYYSLDGGKTYTLGVYIDNDTSDSAGFVEGKYFDLELKAESWVYIKEVLINMEINSSQAAYIGVGIAQWTVPLYTTKTDDDGTVHYYNASNQEVSAEEASDVTPIAPTINPKSPPYATAYRQDYEFQKEFTSDYFYIRTYSYDYLDNFTVPNNEVTVTETNYTATGWGAGMPITNISDGNLNTFIHTSWQVTESKPLNLTFDLGGERTINRISFYCRNNNGMLETPKAFTVEGSLDGETWFKVAEYTDAPRNGHYVIVDFDDATMRYCRLSISQTHQGNGSYYVVIGEIAFTHSVEFLGASQYSPDDKMFTYKGKWKVESCSADFGHVFVGKKATVEFEFDGTMLGIMASKYYGQNYEVYIDGNLVESREVKEDDGDYSLVFLSPELEEGKHSVVIYLRKEGNIDSIVIW